MFLMSLEHKFTLHMWCRKLQGHKLITATIKMALKWCYTQACLQQKYVQNCFGGTLHHTALQSSHREKTVFPIENSKSSSKISKPQKKTSATRGSADMKSSQLGPQDLKFQNQNVSEVIMHWIASPLKIHMLKS